MLKHRFVRGVRIEPGAPHPEKAYFSYMTDRGESDVQFPVADGVSNGRCHLDGEVRADSTSAYSLIADAHGSLVYNRYVLGTARRERQQSGRLKNWISENHKRLLFAVQ